MKQTHKRTTSIIKWSIVIALLIIFCVWQNNDLVVTNTIYTNKNLPDAFDGYKIVQLSDLHNKKFGENESWIIDKVRKQKPDMIVITGDLIDHRRTDVPTAMELINGALTIAPVYYVTGNNEAQSDVYPELSADLTAAGVVIMDDSMKKIEKNGSYIELLGLSDPSFVMPAGINNIEGRLRTLTEKNDTAFKILLSHRPELLDIYADRQVNLVFTGHAHGGQFRIPYVGGLFAPNQGFFPKYTSGSYYKTGTTMIVSRGLGNSALPIRIFNRPEIVSVTLKVK